MEKEQNTWIDDRGHEMDDYQLAEMLSACIGTADIKCE